MRADARGSLKSAVRTETASGYLVADPSAPRALKGAQTQDLLRAWRLAPLIEEAPKPPENAYGRAVADSR
jgi:hypothetical protein